MKYTCLTIVALGLHVAVCNAQSMPGMDMGGNPKNVYLAMMDTMMTAMNKSLKAKTAGDYFLLRMIPHHEGALDMATYEISHGKNFELKQLAKNIYIEQKNEIQLMRIWLTSETADISTSSSYQKEMDDTMMAMMAAMPADQSLDNPDRSFALVMIPHHQAAIDMARVLLKYDKNEILRAYAAQLISNQKNEIEQMKDILNKRYEK
jgi:uncharacterized protein (DUF305 family)